MILNLDVKNMKAFHTLSVTDLGKFNLFVGKNNCGKTTLLENLFLIIAPSNTSLPIKISNFRNIEFVDESYWTQYFHNLDAEKDIEISADVKVHNKLQHRKLDISLSQYYLLENGKKSEFDLSKGISASSKKISGLKYRYQIEDGGAIKDQFELDLSSDGNIIKGTLPEGYKEPLTGAFYGPTLMYVDIPKRFHDLKIGKQTESILRVLKRIDPSILSIDLGFNNIVYCDVGLESLLPLNQMGGGMLKTLGILLAVHSCKDGILLIDEFENGLHFSTMQILWSALIESAHTYNVQVFVTTHSLECIDAFARVATERLQFNDDYRLFRLERDRDLTQIIKFDLETLSSALESRWEIR